MLSTTMTSVKDFDQCSSVLEEAAPATGSLKYSCVICDAISIVSAERRHKYIIERCCSLFCLKKKNGACSEEVYITLVNQE